MNLHSSVEDIPNVGGAYAKRLEKLGIRTIDDLLHHVPTRYQDFSLITKIAHIRVDELATVRGEILEIKNEYTKSGLKIQKATIGDETGRLTAIWFNQPYLTRMLPIGSAISLAGKAQWWVRTIAMISPEYELIRPGESLVHTGRLIPIYPETAGVSSKWLRRKIVNVYKLQNLEIPETLPEPDRQEFGMLPLEKSLKLIHFPKDIDSAKEGRVRLAFDELLRLQIASLKRRNEQRSLIAAKKIVVNTKTVEEFTKSLPFELTDSQKIATKEILKDLGKEIPMNRLLQGDVGSGKTVVAAIASFVAFANGLQTVLMAPTQILAAQHYETLNNLLSPFKVRISLVTGEGIQSDIGKTDVFVGTHALINKSIFENVGLVVIDEQHKFGVEQRGTLIKRTGKRRVAPHFLAMTATPIPRTIALTYYGDLDLSVLRELPKGRIQIKTWVVPPQKRDAAYNWVKKKITEEKVQIFVVCPQIDESENVNNLEVKAVKQEYERLKKIFKSFRLGLLHGKLKAKEKDSVLKKMREGKIDILVTTPVVEVGIDIPNATIMIVEEADRFGLAQLHQLRGRVGRGSKESFCFLFTNSQSEKALSRLKALEKSISGFELAELDLTLRGPGEIFGLRQHGIPELKIASWQDSHLISQSRKLAEKIISHPEGYEVLLNYIEIKKTTPN